MRGPNQAVLSLTLLSACAETEPELRPQFPTDVLEAPARRLELSIYDDARCEELLMLGSVDRLPALRRTIDYPPRRESEALRDAPASAYTLELRAIDAEGRFVGRGCRRVTPGLDPIVVEMSPQPRCGPYRRLHLIVVVESSFEMLRADIGVAEQLRPALLELLLDGFAPEGSRYGAVSAGSEEALASGLGELEGARSLIEDVEFRGRSRLWSGVEEAVSLLRSEAICQALPALVVVAGGPESAEDDTLPIESRLQAEGDPESLDDDVSFFGLGLGDGARPTLLEVAPESALLLEARSEAALRSQLARIRTEILDRLP